MNTGRLVLVGVFFTALLSAQVTASKLLPVPYLGVVVPGGVVAYAFTFVASDCYAELYGRDEALRMVNVGFALNFLLLGLVWFAILSPSAGGVDAAAFEEVLGSSTAIVAGSLISYLVSQNWDVIVFHGLRDRTDGRYLWLRNVLSTGSSQAIDTVLFVAVAFAVAPAVFGVGDPLPTGVLLSLIVGQYLVKLLIAVLDTPVVYAVVGYLSRDEETPVAEFPNT